MYITVNGYSMHEPITVCTYMYMADKAWKKSPSAGKDDDFGHWLFMYNSDGTIMEELQYKGG